MARHHPPRWETPVPPVVAGSYGDRAIRWAKRELGIVPGWWQARSIRRILRHDRAGDLLARIALVSTARQNGKSVIVRVITGWFLDEGQHLPPFTGWTTILAAAHDAKQARIVYQGVGRDLDSSERLRAKARTTIYRGITVDKVDFDIVTSQPGSARGWSAGLIDWDELLTQRDWDMWEALGPTQSAQRSPLMLLTSTAGHADSVVLRRFYDRLVRQASGDEAPDPSFYGAWWQSTDPHAGLDRRQVAQANPALGDGRLTWPAIVQDWNVLPPESWERERLNHWPELVVPDAYRPGVWARCRLPDPLAGVEGPFALGIDVQPGWDRATISVAAVREDGRIGTEVLRDLRSEDGEVTADRIIAEVRAFPELDYAIAIAFDAVSAGAPAFVRAAQEDGRPWAAWRPHEVVAACLDFDELVMSGRLAVDDPLLDAQLATAIRRPVGQEGGFRFGREKSAGPIDALLATVFAVHGIASSPGMPSIS